MQQPKISVIITTKNEEKVIGNLLRSLKSQTFRNFEVLVVDNNSSDATQGIARSFNAKVFNIGPERSTQRNYGAQKAKGKYILILDADMQLTENVLKQLAEKGNSNFKAVVIPEKSIGEGVWANIKAFERSFYVGDEDVEAARFFDKKSFMDFGGYDIGITGPEDWDLPLRMKKSGIKIGRISTYILHNEGRLSLVKALKKKFYYGSHAHSYLKKHPEKIASQGNLLFRKSFFKKWRKFLKNPFLTAAFIFMRSLEALSAASGFAYGLVKYELWKKGKN